jgi:hypothetical protein
MDDAGDTERTRALEARVAAPEPGAGAPGDALAVLDDGRPVTLSFAEAMAYHGGGSPGGVAHAFKVMERAFPLLDPDGPVERREITIETAFGGPGARDAFELVTRAVTGERYRVDPALARPDLGRARERFVFRLGYRGRTVTLLVREGYVTDEFMALARRDKRGPDEECRLEVLKREMAGRVMAGAASAVYATEEEAPPATGAT